jgi:plasmid stability protein
MGASTNFSKDARDDAMASLTIRNLDDDTKAQLRLQAARHGRSMEEEARTILRQAVAPPPTGAEGRGLGSRIHAHFAALGGVELDLPDRASMAEATGFDPEPA